MIELPRPVADLCAALGAQAGVEAVTLGGSRAVGTADEASDWDIGLYYRGRALPAIGPYPDALAEAGDRRGRMHADFSLTHARMRAERGDVAGAVGQAAGAVIETAHALACRRRRWVLNEKALIERMGLEGLHGWFTRVPASPAPLLEWVSGLRSALAAAW